MANYDYDMLVTGSGFRGSVAALLAVEQGYRVGMMESGKRWPDEDIPKVHDIRPLPGRDEIGLGVFMCVIVLTISGYLTVTVL